jgi:hypothetical protein
MGKSDFRSPGKGWAAAAADEPPPTAGHCEVQITGDVTASFSGRQGKTHHVAEDAIMKAHDVVETAVTTDYWRSDGELRRMLKRAYRRDVPAAELEGKVTRHLAQVDPRIDLLALTCGDAKNTIAIHQTAHSRYADVPFSAGKYPITAGSGLGGKGQFWVVSFIDRMHPLEVKTPGTLEITRFDLTGIVGRFSFVASELGEWARVTKQPPRTVRIEAAFAFRCEGERCAR